MCAHAHYRAAQYASSLSHLLFARGIQEKVLDTVLDFELDVMSDESDERAHKLNGIGEKYSFQPNGSEIQR